MSIKIRLIKNNIKRSSSYGKYFAKTVSQGEITLKDLAIEASRNSTLRKSDVIAVVTEIEEMLRYRLAEGQMYEQFFTYTVGTNRVSGC